MAIVAHVVGFQMAQHGLESSRLPDDAHHHFGALVGVTCFTVILDGTE